MTAKEYLSQARRLDNVVNNSLKELEYWMELSKRVSGSNYEINLNPNRPAEAPFALCIEKIDELQRDINNKVDKLVDLRSEIDKALCALGDSEEELVLRYRYLENRTWEDIGEVMDMSVRTAHRVHKSALQHFSVPE